MLGQLPTSLNVSGRKYAIRADYRNILQIISAMSSDKLRDNEKVFVCLKRLYTDFGKIHPDEYEAAYKSAVAFIECTPSSDKQKPQVMDWEQDEQMIFAAVNKVAGQEIRALPFLHWWTFLGFFQGIDRDDVWAYVLGIRQKKASGKPLSKEEKEFVKANPSLCNLNKKLQKKKRKAEDFASELYKELLKGGDEKNG